jgi:putative membrane protein insertion efficiency factor
MISPLMPARCRYYPTCSSYCLECLDTLPIHLALWYSVIRILKCNPIFSGGVDEVPKLKNKCN